MWHGYMWGPWMGIVMVKTILFWGIVLLGLFLLLRARARSGGCYGPQIPPSIPPGTGETPRAILDRRLAAGEISPEDYDILKRKLDEQ